MKKALLLVTLMTMIASQVYAADAAKGQKIYKKCMSCHGKDGYGKKSQNAPMLAGQFDWYIVDQLNAIKSGKRSNKNTKKMYPFIKGLSQTDFEDVAAYLSSLPKLK